LPAGRDADERVGGFQVVDPLVPLRELYGLTPAAAFTPQALKAVRQKMLDADRSRGVVNQRIGRLKRLFKWAVAEGLVPVAVHQQLYCVAGIPKGRGLILQP
jgi:hypothetical protein